MSARCPRARSVGRAWSFRLRVKLRRTAGTVRRWRTVSQHCLVGSPSDPTPAEAGRPGIRTSKPALWWLLTCSVLAIAACTSGPSAPETGDYVADLTAFRAARDQQFQEEKDPVPASRKATLLPLRYFPPDESYVVPAQLRLADERPKVVMPTSTGTLRDYRRVGVLEFILQNQQFSLGAFVEEGQPVIDLFVPFADTTTGQETYPAGRYLDLHPKATGFYTIDFNKAYNPYCAYNETYECPFPPPSNRLKIAIRAGEKKPGA